MGPALKHPLNLTTQCFCILTLNPSGVLRHIPPFKHGVFLQFTGSCVDCVEGYTSLVISVNDSVVSNSFAVVWNSEAIDTSVVVVSGSVVHSVEVDSSVTQSLVGVVISFVIVKYFSVVVSNVVGSSVVLTKYVVVSGEVIGDVVSGSADDVEEYKSCGDDFGTSVVVGTISSGVVDGGNNVVVVGRM